VTASRAAVRGAGTASAAYSTAAQRRSLRRASRVAQTGILAPGDADPPPTGTSDYLDYRGIATSRDIAPLEGQEYELGRFLDPRRGPTREVGIPFEVLRRHAAVIGPTGAGKTKSILVPWIASALRQGHCVVATDIGGDLLDDLMIHRAATGALGAKVSKWDYSHPSDSIGWDWLVSLDDDESMIAAVDAIHGKPRPNDSQPFFHQRDARVLRGVLELARGTGAARSGRDLLELVRDGSKLSALVGANPRHPGANRLTDVVGQHSGTYQQMMSGVINDLEIWDNRGLEAVTRSGGLLLDSFFEEARLLVIGAPIHGGRISEAASGLLLSQVINRLYRRFNTSQGQHVFLVIDEAARLTGRIPIEELLSVSRRARVSVVIATQDVGQFADENERLSILGNCATYISLPSRSSANGEYLSSRLGHRFQTATTVSQGPSPQMPTHGGLTVSSSTSQVPVLGTREILDPPWGERTAIVHCQPMASKPFLVDLTRPEFLA
jgi:type IV secretory pathway TraG/TraD family ATPase VirD4